MDLNTDYGKELYKFFNEKNEIYDLENFELRIQLLTALKGGQIEQQVSLRADTKRKPKHQHSDRDKIYTPEDVAVRLISKIPASDGDSWCDPCYGDGVFYNNFPSDNKEFYEIDMDRNYLNCNKKYDWNVTNIPFSKPKEFIFKMADCSRKGFGILCLANSMTATRLKELGKLGFCVHSITILYIKSWGFGYRTDFYVFTKQENDKFEIIISESN